MSTEGLQPVVVDQYGGLCTLIDRSDLPVGLSPDCRNVEFFPGGVKSRGGLTEYKTAGDVVSQLFSYVTTAGARYTILHGSGWLGVIPPGGVIAGLTFAGSGVTTTGFGGSLFMRGAVLDGRAFLAFSDGKIGVAGPYQYDGVSVSAVGQYGPSANFLLADIGAGVVSAGVHSVAIAYETSTGYVTGVPGISNLNVGVNGQIQATQIPLGPGTVAKRIVFATAAGGTDFFTLPRFVINDNTTTTLNMSFTDSELLAGTALEDFVDNTPLTPMAGVEKYGSRLVYWGGGAALQSFIDVDITALTPTRVGLLSLNFDGAVGVLPDPWLAFVAGGTISTATGVPLLVYKITGDGATANRGQIEQGRSNYALSRTYYVRPGRRYGIRAHVRRNSTAAAGTLSIVATYSTPAPATTFASLTKTVASISQNWSTISDESASVSTGASGQFVQMVVKISGVLTNGGIVEIDWIELYDIAEKDAASIVYITPPSDPEAIRLATDLVVVSDDDGQAIRNVFQLRGNLYICKERSLYVTTDNGDEPFTWTVDQVSNEVGTPSVHGVAAGDGWAIIASRNGVYYFTGGAPEKISQEIQPTWDTINWLYGHTIWTAIDTSRKRVFIGAPFGAETKPTSILVLDYVEGFSDPISGGGAGRKWTFWNSSAIPGFTHGIMAERDDLTSDFIMATGLEEIRIYDSAAVNDLDAPFFPINAYYETAPIGTEIGRALFDRVLTRIRGAGTLVSAARRPGGTLTTVANQTLEASPDNDLDLRFHDTQTQIGIRVGTNTLGSYWSLRRLAVFLQTSPYTFLRRD